MSQQYTPKGKLKRNAIRQGRTRRYEEARHAAEVEAFMRDVAVYGVGMMQEGRRIDPMVVAVDLVPAKASMIFRQGNRKNG